MLYWLAPIVTGVGWLAWRSWRRDAAIRSGELMDVRDLRPDGAARLELRALQERLYRVEVQLELEPVSMTATAEFGEASPAAGEAESIELAIHRVAASGAEGGDTLIRSGHRALGESIDGARRAGLISESAHSGRMHGSVPIAEFDVDALVRLRFDVALADDTLVVETRAGQRRMRIVKAHAVIKERVRPLRLPGGVPERMRIATRQSL